MKLHIDTGEQSPQTIDNPSFQKIETCILQVDGQNHSFMILEKEENDYIQCAGNKYHLTVEIRQKRGEKFKHYIIGTGEIKSSLKSSWVMINCRVGPIRVKKEELLNKNDAIELFRCFFLNEPFSDRFYKRDVTRKII